MFLKSLASITRAGASKPLWTTSQASQTPGFFVSTPQFNRQQRLQLELYKNQKRAQNHTLCNNNMIPVVSATGHTSAHNHIEDEAEDEQTQPPEPQKVNITSEKVQLESGFIKQTQDPLEDLVISSNPSQQEVDYAVRRLVDLNKRGKHALVLQRFTELEEKASHLPIDAYNAALLSLGELGIEALDVAPLLQAYEKLLSMALPNKRTYAIVISALVKVAQKMHDESIRRQLAVGNANHTVLDSVVDASEQDLAPAQHVRLALHIFLATVSVNAKHYSKNVADQLVEACVEFGVEYTDLVPYVSKYSCAIMRLQTSSEAALRLFRKADKKHELLPSLVSKLCELGDADNAIRAYAQHHSDHAALKVLIESLCTAGFVAYAGRWFAKAGDALSFEQRCEILRVLSLTNSAPAQIRAEVAFKIFENVAQELTSFSSPREADALNLARSAYVQLCLAANKKDHLMVALKETHLRDAMWSPTTTFQTIVYLIGENHVELALDVLEFQSTKLTRAWASADVGPFIGRELLDRVVETLQAQNKLDVASICTLIKVPFLNTAFEVSELLLEKIWALRKNNDPAFVAALNSSQELIKSILMVISTWVNSSEGHEMIAIPKQKLSWLREMLASFASLAIEKKVPFLCKDSNAIGHSLKLLQVDLPWFQANTGLNTGLEHDLHTASSEQARQQVLARENAEIMAFAGAPAGTERAIELLEVLLVRGAQPTLAPVLCLVNALFSSTDQHTKARLRHVYQLLLTRYPSHTLSSEAFDFWVQVHRTYVRFASLVPTLAQAAHKRLLDMGSSPCSFGYAALIAEQKSSMEAIPLFKEAKSNNVADSTDVYEALVPIVARDNHHSVVSTLYDEITRLEVPKTYTILVNCLESALKTNDSQRGLELFDELEALPNYSPQTQPYETLLRHFVHKEGNKRAALGVFSRLRESGAVISQEAYKLLIEALILSPMDLDKADLVLAMMKATGTPANTQHFATLLRARGVDSHNLDAARDFYRGLVKNDRVRPDTHIFQALVDSYVANHHQKELGNVIYEMQNYRVPVSGELQRLAM